MTIFCGFHKTHSLNSQEEDTYLELKHIGVNLTFTRCLLYFRFYTRLVQAEKCTLSAFTLTRSNAHLAGMKPMFYTDLCCDFLASKFNIKMYMLISINKL